MAELDYIEVVEKMKEDYEAEVVEDSNLKDADKVSESEGSIHSSESEDELSKKETDYEYDREFVPYKKHKIINEVKQAMKPKLRKRDKDDTSTLTDTVTISDDEDGLIFYNQWLIRCTLFCIMF